MNDEQVVEVLREQLTEMDRELAPAWTDGQVKTLLAALRTKGVDVYRPDEHPAITVVDDAGPGETSRWGPSAAAMDMLEHCRPGTYRLVPVGGDS